MAGVNKNSFNASVNIQYALVSDAGHYRCTTDVGSDDTDTNLQVTGHTAADTDKLEARARPI